MIGGKMVVLKPIVWNDQGYRWPAGKVASSGYTKEHGYGHEEWNGRDDWVWDGWKVFHTQAKGAMHRYAAHGRLAIVMTAMKEGRFYAVGVACNVYENNDEDAEAIARGLNLPSYADGMWDVASIRKAKGTPEQLRRHWLAHMHVNWRCPQTHYAWFGEPVEIVPNRLIPANPPRKAIVKMHGSYQSIRPDQALSIVRQALPDDHSVVGWLSTGTFDPVRNNAVRNAPKPKGGKKSASTAADPFKRYMQEYEIVVSPLHGRLQGDFQAHLGRARMKDIRPDIDRVDLRYRDPARGRVLVEVKPTEPATVRFAIRTALGQLLDYQQRTKGTHALLVVIDDEPSREDADLALTNGFGIAWREGRGFSFAWPG
jgi:hypothetical protein